MKKIHNTYLCELVIYMQYNVSFVNPSSLNQIGNLKYLKLIQILHLKNSGIVEMTTICHFAVFLGSSYPIFYPTSFSLSPTDAQTNRQRQR